MVTLRKETIILEYVRNMEVASFPLFGSLIFHPILSVRSEANPVFQSVLTITVDQGPVTGNIRKKLPSLIDNT